MKYWVGTVSKEHVMRGVAGGFCQVCHGKAAPLRRMRQGDMLLYYSPALRRGGADKCQAFTALGYMADEAVYPFQMAPDFIPHRRNVRYARIARECPLQVARQHPEWKQYARLLRYGHFEVSADFALAVQTFMLAATPLDGPVEFPAMAGAAQQQRLI